ncbi:hypothetical protein D5R40_26700 [Okeania hirsuta]|uniref:Uncharacterized protein n=1 Tax=Okeania hirsuta TaxID=1458930 RepID=A0A3N6PK66_9CYAN|nr:hypothetical protein D5R40_26700 [Okeania hirsuta]
MRNGIISSSLFTPDYSVVIYKYSTGNDIIHQKILIIYLKIFDQKIRSIASPFKGMKKNQVQYFKSLTLTRGTDK